MALGDFGNKGENNQQDFRPETYGYAFFNGESAYDKVGLKLSMWKGLLIFRFCPKVDSGNEYSTYDSKNALSIYVNPSKANIIKYYLMEFLELIKKDPKTKFNKAIQTNTGIISINTGIYAKTKEIPFITGMKVNDSGQITQSLNYEFKLGMDFGIIDYNPDDASYSTEVDPFKYDEIQRLIIQLDEYVKGSTNAIAASVTDRLSFEFNKIENTHVKIANKLGVEIGGRGGYSNTTKQSYFSNNSNGGSSSKSSNGNFTNTTLDELEL